MLSGLNQGGKSTALLLLMSWHLTGLYPDWWDGHVFDHPVNAMLGGETAETTRDLLIIGSEARRGLLGDIDKWDNGMIPAWCIDPKHVMKKKQSEHGVVDSFKVRHHTDGKFDGFSRCKVFAYAKGWQKLQGYTIHLIGVDEEPPFEVYGELDARTNKTGGRMVITMTPLNGYTQLYEYFDTCPNGFRKILPYGVADATHLTDEERKRLYSKYEGSHMEATRLHGIPTVGRGLIYPVFSQDLIIPPEKIPDHWTRVIGLDFPHTSSGYFAACSLAFDPEGGEVWMVADYKRNEGTLEEYAGAVKRMGGDTILCVWPHDGGRQQDGRAIYENYAAAGLNMHSEYAHMLITDGNKTKRSNSVGSIIQEAFDLMKYRKFKVFSTCTDFVKEVRTYRADGNQPLKKQDDHVIDAMHKGLMMRRMARSGGQQPTFKAVSDVNLDFDFFSMGE